MRILVCGGRDYTDIIRVHTELYELAESNVIDCIIQGEAKGADALAKKWAEIAKVDCLSFPADWDKYGKAAGSIRNKQMLTEGKPDLVIAFPGGRGTADMVKQAKEAGVEVYEVS